MTTDRNRTAASLWGINIAKDVSAATPLGPEVTYAFPEVDAELVVFAMTLCLLCLVAVCMAVTDEL
jgi:hypothetical protein